MLRWRHLNVSVASIMSGAALVAVRDWHVDGAHLFGDIAMHVQHLIEGLRHVLGGVLQLVYLVHVDIAIHVFEPAFVDACHQLRLPGLLLLLNQLLLLELVASFEGSLVKVAVR